MKRLLTFLLSVATVLSGLAPAVTANAALPPLQLLYGNAYFDKVFYYNGSTYVDETTDASDSGTDDVQLGSAGATNGVAYFGLQSPFDEIHFKMGPAGPGGDLVWEYSKSGVCLPPLTCWGTLTETSNPSDDFDLAVNGETTYIKFALPATGFAPRTVNGYSAYWIRARTVSPYDIQSPQASLVKAVGYNAKAVVQSDEAVAYGNDIATSEVVSDCSIWKTWNPNSDGTHYVAINTDGSSCSLKFQPDGFLTGSVLANNVQNPSTSLKDLGTFSIFARLKITVEDELGNAINDATVRYDGTLAPIYAKENRYYIPAPVLSNKTLSVVRSGYVTEDQNEQALNKGFADVSTGDNVTAINMTGMTACTSAISPGTTACKVLWRDFEAWVRNINGSSVSGASVTVYTDAAMTQIANDVTKSGQSDAQGTTDGNGKVWLGLTTATYYLKVTAPTYTDATAQKAVTNGLMNTAIVMILKPGEELPPPVPEDTNVSAAVSTVGVSPASIVADGLKTATLTVIARNQGGLVLSGKTVTANSSLAGVTITPAQATTNSAGEATFTVKSTIQGTTMLSATADGVPLSTTANLALTAPIQASCQTPVVSVGSLVKLPDDGNLNTQEDSAVYYYGADCKRHAFPNSRVYFTWYANFNDVSVVQAATLASMTLGPNVTYRPGVKMVKFLTDPKVYAVSQGGVLRWVTTEQVAIGLYGTAWNTKIDDISDAFYSNYAFGTNIADATAFNVSAEMANALVIDDSL